MVPEIWCVKDGRTDGWTDGRMDEWTGGWTEKVTVGGGYPT